MLLQIFLNVHFISYSRISRVACKVQTVFSVRELSLHCLLLHSCSPLYSAEVMEDAIEPLSQSRSMFLLFTLLSVGKDSVEHTDPALAEHTCRSVKCQRGHARWDEPTIFAHKTQETSPLWLNLTEDAVIPSHQRERRSSMAAAQIS